MAYPDGNPGRSRYQAWLRVLDVVASAVLLTGLAILTWFLITPLEAVYNLVFLNPTKYIALVKLRDHHWALAVLLFTFPG